VRILNIFRKYTLTYKKEIPHNLAKQSLKQNI